MKNKDDRTYNAICNLLGCSVFELHGNIPPLGERGVIVYHRQGWAYDEEEGIITLEEITLSFDRLPSGRIGKWEARSEDWDYSQSTTPTLIDEWVAVAEGKGQWAKIEWKRPMGKDQMGRY